MSTEVAQAFTVIAPLAALLPTDGSFNDTALVVVIGVALLLLFSLLFGLLLISRRQQSREVREMVVAVEELRSGHTRRRAEIDPRSSLAMLADAVNRLAQDLSGRFSDAENAREQLEGFLDAARDYAVVTTNADWDIRTFSQGASDLFGWAEEEADARPASLLFEDASWKDLLPKLARRSLRERGVETRSVMARRDGAGFHADLLVRQLRGSGEDAGYLLVIKNVSSQVRLETELRESESRYRSLVDGLSEGVVIVQDGLVAYVNPAVAELLGHSDDQICGRLLRRWIATRDLLVVEHALSSVAGREGERQTVRCTLVNAEGESVARVRMDVSGMHHDGKAASLVAIIDETVDQQVAEQLRLNQRRLDAVLESTTDGIVVLTETDAGSLVNMTNAAFVTTFGLSQDRLLGASEKELLEMLRARGGGAEAVAEFLAATEGADRGEAITVADAPYRELELRLAPLIGDSGKVIGRVLACRDLTTQKSAEKGLADKIEDLRKGKDALKQAYRRLHGLNRDLSHRGEQLDNLNKELRKLDEMKSNLLANVSHELQTPLVSIRGYTEMILKGRLGATTDEQQKGLTLSLRNIDRLIAMIDNLLTFARMDREAAEIEITTFQLRTVIDESLDVLKEKVEAKGIEVAHHLEDPDVTVRADRDKVLQVFLNLLSNAIKFNRDGGRIEVTTRMTDDAYVMVQVRDTGSGIPEDGLEKIFDRFYQEGASLSGSGEGTGIGLAIVRNILRLHGCSIRAESTVGLGTTFSFTLPLAGPKPAESGGEPPEPEAPVPEAPESPEPEPKAARRPRFRVIRRPNRS
jgi:PAS domain S-box-containing protein